MKHIEWSIAPRQAWLARGAVLRETSAAPLGSAAEPSMAEVPLPSQCGSFAEGDELVEAAMQSDCDECRAKLGIAATTNKGCEPRPAPVYTPQPDADADDALAAAVARRDGR